MTGVFPLFFPSSYSISPPYEKLKVMCKATHLLFLFLFLSFQAYTQNTEGCIPSASCTDEHSALAVSVWGSASSCGTCCNGSASAAGSGGMMPYSYVWSPGGDTG